MLGALAVALLYFWHRDLDRELAWGVLLWLSAAGFVVTAGWTVWQKLGDLFV